MIVYCESTRSADCIPQGRPIVENTSTALADFTDYSVRRERRTLILGGTDDNVGSDQLFMFARPNRRI
jgi:hypothetical protein